MLGEPQRRVRELVVQRAVRMEGATAKGLRHVHRLDGNERHAVEEQKRGGARRERR